MKLRDRLGKHLAEELQNIIAHEARGGLWPGDTISHRTARELAERGLIQRNPQATGFRAGIESLSARTE